MQDNARIESIELPEQLRFLQEQGRQLANAGKHEEAERVLRELLRHAPNHVPVLRYLASRAVAREDFAEAQKLIEQAIRIAPDAPMLHQHLAIILRARGFLKGSLLAFEATLRLEPRQPMHWIQRGEVLESLGRDIEATASYKRAADLSGNLGSLARAKQNALEVLPVIGRAARKLIRAREDAVNRQVGGLVDEHGTEALARVIEAKRHLTKSIPPAYADPLQRPAFCYCPSLRAQPFFKAREIPALRSLEERTAEIVEELRGVLGDPGDLAPYVEAPPGREAQWRELNGSRKWSSYHLYKGGRRIDGHCARCPKTTEAIESLPLVRLQGHAPEVFFSILEPGTHIPPHFGLANYKLAVHLPLLIPDGCAIRVGDNTQTWAPGKCLVFDDSFEHEAWNRSDEKRAVLIFEVWHPDLSEPEKRYLEAALAAYDNLNAKLDRINQPLMESMAGPAFNAPAPTGRAPA